MPPAYLKVVFGHACLGLGFFRLLSGCTLLIHRGQHAAHGVAPLGRGSGQGDLHSFWSRLSRKWVNVQTLSVVDACFRTTDIVVAGHTHVQSLDTVCDFQGGRKGGYCGVYDGIIDVREYQPLFFRSHNIT